MSHPERHYKDTILHHLAERVNVAQFVSFGPDLAQRYAWIRGFPPGHRFGSLEEAVAAILEVSPERSVNIRSFEPQNPKSREFLYGQTGREQIVREVRRLAAGGLFTIINETVDIHDGGVSGVAFGNVLEFAPEDIPRCVEKPGTASLPRELGLRLLQTVYGFSPDLPPRPELRVEFSLHPLPRGYHFRHTIIWEIEEAEPDLAPTEAHLGWPNRFSRFLGDKTFGLLVADAFGLEVPRTTVLPRKLPPFSFGSETGSAETWIRTCPTEQVPGYFTTRRGWLDPFRLMQEEDPTGEAIASILAQRGVDARYSGALVTQADGSTLIEGVAGRGDEFMTGHRAPESLPKDIERSLHRLYQRAHEQLGPVRFEWVHDGRAPWVIQLHKGATVTAGRTIYPGEATHYHFLQVTDGIDALRALIERVRGTGEGIVLVGRVGVTSHLGDLLRRARIPSRIEARDA